MNYTFYILFTLSFLSCKQNQGVSSEGEHKEMTQLTDTMLNASNQNNQASSENQTVVNNKTPEMDSPVSTDKSANDKDNMKDHSEDVSTDGHNYGQDSKPELPPVYKDPKPIPGKTNDADGENTDQKSGMHDLFDRVLNKYVSANGKVNYNGLKANRSDLDKYTRFLSQNPPKASWSNDKKLAYWINAYNAFTLTKVIDNYPIKSIMDLDNGKTWDVKWIQIGNNTYSLNNIENDIIRPNFDEPRIHFAVNCAAKSCPPLIDKAYTSENLDRLMERNTKSFINNSSFNTISDSTIEISKIFEWYKDDFGDLIEYLNRYSDTKINKGATINFKPYNWSLNN
jgi:hypothetical protein